MTAANLTAVICDRFFTSTIKSFYDICIRLAVVICIRLFTSRHNFLRHLCLSSWQLSYVIGFLRWVYKNITIFASAKMTAVICKPVFHVCTWFSYDFGSGLNEHLSNWQRTVVHLSWQLPPVKSSNCQLDSSRTLRSQECGSMCRFMPNQT